MNIFRMVILTNVYLYFLQVLAVGLDFLALLKVASLEGFLLKRRYEALAGGTGKCQ